MSGINKLEKPKFSRKMRLKEYIKNSIYKRVFPEINLSESQEKIATELLYHAKNDLMENSRAGNINETAIRGMFTTKYEKHVNVTYAFRILNNDSPLFCSFGSSDLPDGVFAGIGREKDLCLIYSFVQQQCDKEGIGVILSIENISLADFPYKYINFIADADYKF